MVETPMVRPRAVRFVLGGAFGGNEMNNAAGYRTGFGWHGVLGLRAWETLGIEARYAGSWNQERDSNDSARGLLTNGVSGHLRITLPTPVLKPFIHAGLGVLWMDPRGGAPQSAQGAPTTVGQLPFGGGVEIGIGRVFAITGEFTYHLLFTDAFHRSEVSGWGDPMSVTGGVRFYL